MGDSHDLAELAAGEPGESLLRRADMALNEAKKLERNRGVLV
jgi:PleD family two-component response regulator